MIRKEILKLYQADSELVEELGFNPYYPDIQGGLEQIVTVAGKTCYDLASNNYLSISRHPQVIKAMKEALDRYGSSMCGTPVATGSCSIYEETTATLSRFSGLPRIMLFPSAYQANNGLFAALANSDDLIIIDHYAHSSLLEGAKSAGCRIWPFLHNNMKSLERILKKAFSCNKVFVVTESVFSTEGSIAPFDRINSLCLHYGAVPVIDDSHGIGVLGSQGRGILSHFSITDYKGIYTASLGKAMGCFGGMVAGSDDSLKALRYFCSHLIYSTALPPVNLAAIISVVRLLEQEHEQRRSRLDFVTKKLRLKLQSLGAELSPAQAPIISVRCKGTKETLKAAKNFYDNGLLGTPFVPPSVSAGGGVLRLIAKAGFSDDTVTAILERLEKIF